MRDYELEYKIDDLLEQMAQQGRIHFAPQYICEKLGISDIEMVSNYLLSLVPKILVPLFEVECPEGDSDLRIKNPDSILNETRVCQYCGVEYIPDPNRIWLAFNFSNSYKEYVKKKQMYWNNQLITRKKHAFSLALR